MITEPNPEKDLQPPRVYLGDYVVIIGEDPQIAPSLAVNFHSHKEDNTCLVDIMRWEGGEYIKLTVPSRILKTVRESELPFIKNTRK